MEGDREDYNKSDNYYKPSTTWVHTTASLSDSPFHTASMSYGGVINNIIQLQLIL